MTFAHRAESLFRLWLSTVVRDETGTRASEIYDAFLCFAERIALQADEIPTSAAFGRRLTAEGFAPIHRADGNWRPLRPLAVTDPAPAFSQVSLSESLEPPDSVAGSPENPVVPHSGSHARVHTQRTHAQDPISTVTEISPPTLQPATVTHPSNPSWAKRWQAKLDAAPTPKDRAAEAWSLVLAVAARCESPIGEGAFSELADTLVDLANNMWPPKPAPPAVQAHDVYDSRGNFLYRYDPADFA